MTWSALRAGKGGCALRLEHEPGVIEERREPAADRLEEGKTHYGEKTDDELHRAIDEPARSSLVRGVVVQEIEEQSHVQRPECGRRNPAELDGHCRLRERLVEHA